MQLSVVGEREGKLEMMTRQNLINRLRNIAKAARVFVLVKRPGDDSSMPMVADIEKDCQSELGECYCNVLRGGANDAWEESFPAVGNFDKDDDRKDCLYAYEHELPDELKFLSEIADDKDNSFVKARTEDIENTKGIIIKLGVTDDFVLLFKMHSQVNIFSPKKWMLKWVDEQRLERTKEVQLRLSESYDLLYVDGNLLVKNMVVAEGIGGIRSRRLKDAESLLKKLERGNLVEDLSKLSELAQDIRNMTLIRKMSNLQSSGISIDSGFTRKLFDFVASKKEMKGRLRIVGGKGKERFQLSSKADCEVFLKLLSDDYLLSEITGRSYEVNSKEEMRVKNGRDD